MISHDETARREEAHVKADMAWSRAYKRSLTNGLGDAVREHRHQPTDATRGPPASAGAPQAAVARRSRESAELVQQASPMEPARSRPVPVFPAPERAGDQSRAEALRLTDPLPIGETPR